MIVTIDNVWIYLTFIGGKTKETDIAWSKFDWEDYVLPCLPIAGDVIDFKDSMSENTAKVLI